MSEPNLGLERAARGWEGGPRWGTSPRPLRSVGRELFSACVACGPIFTEWNPMPDDVDQLISRGEDQAPAQAPEPRPITSVRQADHCRSTADELCNQCWHRGLGLVGGHLAPRSVPGGVSTPQKLPSGL